MVFIEYGPFWLNKFHTGLLLYHLPLCCQPVGALQILPCVLGGKKRTRPGTQAGTGPEEKRRRTQTYTKHRTRLYTLMPVMASSSQKNSLSTALLSMRRLKLRPTVPPTTPPTTMAMSTGH